MYFQNFRDQPTTVFANTSEVRWSWWSWWSSDWCSQKRWWLFLGSTHFFPTANESRTQAVPGSLFGVDVQNNPKKNAEQFSQDLTDDRIYLIIPRFPTLLYFCFVVAMIVIKLSPPTNSCPKWRKHDFASLSSVQVVPHCDCGCLRNPAAFAIPIGKMEKKARQIMGETLIHMDKQVMLPEYFQPYPYDMNDVSRHECGIRILTLANNDPTLEMPWSSIFFWGNSLCIEVFSWENRRYLEALVGRQAGNGGKVIPLHGGLDGKNHGTNGVDLPAGLSPYGSSCTFSGSTTGVWFRGLAVASQTVFGSIWSTGYPQHWT